MRMMERKSYLVKTSPRKKVARMELKRIDNDYVELMVIISAFDKPQSVRPKASKRQRNPTENSMVL